MNACHRNVRSCFCCWIFEGSCCAQSCARGLCHQPWSPQKPLRQQGHQKGFPSQIYLCFAPRLARESCKRDRRQKGHLQLLQELTACVRQVARRQGPQESQHKQYWCKGSVFGTLRHQSNERRRSGEAEAADPGPAGTRRSRNARESMELWLLRPPELRMQSPVLVLPGLHHCHGCARRLSCRPRKVEWTWCIRTHGPLAAPLLRPSSAPPTVAAAWCAGVG
jgi:hypothetical protein